MPVHAEDEDRLKQRKSAFHNPSVLDHPEIRDTESARLATQRLMDLVRKTSRPTHILHVSTADEVPLIAGAKREGLPVTAEVTPQHLWFAAPEAYTKLGSLAQMNPPIRGSAHREALWDGLRSGIFDVFGSDHAPHTLEEKAQAYPNSPSGMTGVQTFLPVLLTFVARGDLSLEQVVAMTSERPANLYGVASRGRIELGYWADLAIVDIHRRFKVEREWIKSKAGWSPYEGIELTGWPEETFVSGRPADPSAGRMVEFEWKASG
jgi:dihydroorotase